MPETRSDGLKISYDDAGQGEPVLLFLPGWCSSRAAFTQLALRCARHRRTLALDWRGHGQSQSPPGDFSGDGLVQDALAVIEASHAQHIVPVALSHAGWIAIELRRKLADRVLRLVLLDWIILDPPPPFLDVLNALQDAARWEQARDQLFSIWTEGVNNTEIISFVQADMGSYSFAMWARAGREISSAYARAGSPVQALSKLNPPVPVLHLYAQPEDPGYLAAQQAFANAHPWFNVRKLEARSHFPMFEVPEEIAEAIERFLT